MRSDVWRLRIVTLEEQVRNCHGLSAQRRRFSVEQFANELAPERSATRNRDRQIASSWQRHSWATSWVPLTNKLCRMELLVRDGVVELHWVSAGGRIKKEQVVLPPIMAFGREPRVPCEVFTVSRIRSSQQQTTWLVTGWRPAARK